MWRDYLEEEDPGRIEVPVYLKDDILRTTAASLGDPVPCKAPMGLNGAPISPSGVADDAAVLATVLGGSTYTTSQPNSATSSLASLLPDADLQVSSRASSGSDLGARPCLPLLPLPSGGDSGACLSARSDVYVHDEAVESIVMFDCAKLPSLNKIKTRSPPGVSMASSSRGPTPAAPSAAARSLTFTSSKDGGDSMAVDMVVRPLRTRPMPQPGTYNPYDLAGLLSDFRNNKNSSPVNVRAPPPRPRPASRLNLGSAVSWASSSDVCEVDSIVMIPGARRAL